MAKEEQHAKEKGKQSQKIEEHQQPAEQRNPADTVRARDKILAACAGGCLTSLTMTPLDVVKTRLQISSSVATDHRQTIHSRYQHHHHPLFSQPIGASCPGIEPHRYTCSTGAYHLTSTTTTTTTAAAAAPRESVFSSLRGQPSTNHPAAFCSTHHSLCLPLHGPSSSACSHPTTTLNHLLHDHPLSQVYASRPSPSSPGLLATLLQIVRLEGITSLWRGIAPTLMISIPAQAIYMLGYDSLRSAFFDLVPATSRDAPASASSPAVQLIPLVSGVLSRSFVVVLFSPLELIRTRLQSTPRVRPQTVRLAPFDPNGLGAEGGGGGARRTILKSVVGAVRLTGLRSLYAGLPATLWRDVPFSGLYWSSYEAIRRLVSGGLGFGEADRRASVHQLALQSFLAGSLSGAVAATLTNPFDVVKTRRQASPLLLSSPDPSSPTHRSPRAPGTIRIILQIARSEGLRKGLMRGLSPRLAKVIPGCGIMIASYEGLAQALSKY
ncbi:hypothetical protein PCANC_15590 [Puccinia coronata f. sp. avenae]|uniref:Mitochondrial carrier protein n=1 Tax=Puccinia coronata f. sp. avenae TaxID=200324 RepID=A0A2N5SKD1_9BASI|nr:hypothetical protein PCANC_15590 [Puccinia coronata f. sp. avenae]